jgi:hypothetical protein
MMDPAVQGPRDDTIVGAKASSRHFQRQKTNSILEHTADDSGVEK